MGVRGALSGGAPSEAPSRPTDVEILSESGRSRELTTERLGCWKTIRGGKKKEELWNGLGILVKRLATKKTLRGPDGSHNCCRFRGTVLWKG